MKKFRVIVTPDAESELRGYLTYLRREKKNPQAAKNVLKDFTETKKALSSVAKSLPDPESEKLRERGLKRINFGRHNYFLLYYIDENDVVFVTDVFHGLENFEEKLR